MNSFDKIKVVSNIKYISYINRNVFTKKMRNGRIASWQYTTNDPYNLMIEKNKDRNELVIEFTGKILLDDYPQLISESTIHQCFENINKLGICKLDIDSIIKDSQVVKCDVTQDISYKKNIKDLTSGIIDGIKNHKKYSYRQDGGNLTLKNNVSTKNRQVSLIVYNKEEEMERATNRAFMSSIKCPERLSDSFKDKTRFEINLKSVKQIKERLHINDNRLLSIFESSAQPILDFLNEIIKPCSGQPKGITNLHDYLRYLLLVTCDFDLKKVENIVRSYGSPKASISRKMEPYKNLLKVLQEGGKDVREELNEILSH